MSIEKFNSIINSLQKNNEISIKYNGAWITKKVLFDNLWKSVERIINIIVISNRLSCCLKFKQLKNAVYFMQNKNERSKKKVYNSRYEYLSVSEDTK